MNREVSRVLSPSPRRGEGRGEGVFRRGLAAALLVVVGASVATALRPQDVARRWRLLLESVAGERVAPAQATGFWFDPDYALFLDAVRRRTPKNATVAVLVPSWPDVYLYQAAYQLAPRRVVDRRWEEEASYVAAYRGEKPEAPGAIRVPHGTLARR